MAYSRYYRHILSPAQQQVYDQVLKGITERKKEVRTLPITAQDFQKITHALNYDNPQLFYVNFNGFRLLQSMLSCTFLLAYTVDESGQRAVEYKLKNVCSQIMHAVTGKTMKSAALIIHDWLVKNISYSECAEFPNAGHNIVGALLYSRCVCEGYAKAYKYLADMIRMRCIVVGGKGIHPDGASGAHAWNVVKLNTNCFHVDVTFDSLIADRYCSRAYFLLSDREILLDHICSEEFKLPECPADGNILTTVSGTAELLRFLESQYKSGATHSEVRLTKGFTIEKLMSMINNRISASDIVWYNHIQSYRYGNYSRTLFVCWR